MVQYMRGGGATTSLGVWFGLNDRGAPSGRGPLACGGCSCERLPTLGMSELWTLSLRARMVLQVEACKNQLRATADPMPSAFAYLSADTKRSARRSRAILSPPLLPVAFAHRS